MLISREMFWFLFYFLMVFLEKDQWTSLCLGVDEF